MARTKYSGRYVTIGPPGCGKTHWLSRQVQACLEAGADVLLCSLTRTAAHEIADRVEREGVKVDRERIGTLHAHAYRSLGRPEIAESCLKEWNEYAPTWRIGLSGAVDPDDPLAAEPESDDGPGNELMTLYQLERARMTPRELWPMSVQAFASEWEEWKRQLGRLDFTDLIEKAADEPTPMTPAVILADEAQDLSALEHRLLSRWSESADAQIVVGDPWQALYTWRGASPEIFSASDVDHRHLLGKSYRVPRVIRDVALRWASQLSDFAEITYEPRTDEESGEVIEGLAEPIRGSWRSPEMLVEWIDERSRRGQSVMLAGSCGYHLRPTVAVLKAFGIPFANPWRRHNRLWNPLHVGRGTSTTERVGELLKLAGQRRESWLAGSLAKWIPLLQAEGVLKHGAKAASTKLDAATEITADELAQWFVGESLALLRSAMSGAIDVGSLVAWLVEKCLPKFAKQADYISRIVGRFGVDGVTKAPNVFVGTVHSFKGGEADVVVLYPDLSNRGLREWLGEPSARDNVVRTYYVGMTRAREELRICQPSSAYACSAQEYV